MKKNIDIELLRAIAIAFTLLVHLKIVISSSSPSYLWFITHLELSVGVDLFFAISGFVITKSLHQSTVGTSHKKRALIVSFWIKRAFRLLPLSLFWLGMTTLFLYLARHTIETTFIDNLMAIVAAILHVMNLYVPHCFNNADSGLCGVTNFHGHYWSLSLEEQFYFVFPFLFFFLGRKGLIFFLTTAILMQLFWNRPLLSTWWFFRTDALCWGALIALLSETKSYQKIPPTFFSHKLFSWVSLALVIVAFPMISSSLLQFGESAKPYGVGMVALICAVIVFIASYDNNYLTPNKKVAAIANYLGARSYALYVTHLTIFFIVTHLYKQINPQSSENIHFSFIENSILVFLCLLVTFIVSEVCYRTIETTARRKGRKLSEHYLHAKKHKQHA